MKTLMLNSTPGRSLDGFFDAVDTTFDLVFLIPGVASFSSGLRAAFFFFPSGKSNLNTEYEFTFPPLLQMNLFVESLRGKGVFAWQKLGVFGGKFVRTANQNVHQNKL